MGNIEKLPDGGARMIMLSEGIASIKCTSKWNDSTKTAEILKDGKVIAVVTQGSDSSTVFGKVFKLDTVVDNIDGRLWVPVAFFSKGLGCEMKLETDGKPAFLTDRIADQTNKPATPTATTAPARPTTGTTPAAPARPATGTTSATPARPATGTTPTTPARPTTGTTPATPARPTTGTTSPASTSAKPTNRNR